MKPPEDHPEWGNDGRDPRWPPGWWLIPIVVLGIAFWAWLIF